MNLRTLGARALALSPCFLGLAPLGRTAPVEGGRACVDAGRQTAGSLLLFPEFDNRNGNLTLLTVTNRNCDALTGTIDVEFVYVGRYGPNGVSLDCLEFNRTRRLTPCDTISLFTNVDNPGQSQGYAYAFAKSTTTGAAVVFNHLIGQTLYIGVDLVDDSVVAVPFQGVGTEGSPTDHNQDHLRQLDGSEYSRAPDQILIPRFLGQDPDAPGASFKSRLVLIGLSGGTGFHTTVDLQIFNDNEELFSGQYTFQCWAAPTLTQISGAFAQTYLASTNQAQNESLGAAGREYGWLRLNGNVAYSTSQQIPDPAVYAVLVERVGAYGAIDLPYELCSQGNGTLLLANGSGLPNAPPPPLDKLYATSFGSTANLLSLNPTTGAGTLIGPSGVGLLRGLAFDPNTNTLYGTSQSGGNLLRLDRTTGHAVVIGPPSGVFGLTFDANTSTLYGVTPGGSFYRFDTNTGVATFIGLTGFSGMRGLAFDPNTNTLYGASYFACKLLRVDPTTGAATPIGNLTCVNGGFHGLAFHPDTNTLFGVELAGILSTIDTTTAAITPIGPVGFDMNNIAFGR